MTTLNDIRILPHDVHLTGGAVVRINASSRRRASEKALIGRSKGCRVTKIETVVGAPALGIFL